MSTVLTPPIAAPETVGASRTSIDQEVLAAAERLGVSASRIADASGDVTWDEWAASYDANGRVCEFVDGVVLEKAVGAEEAGVALKLGFLFEGANERFRAAADLEDPPYHLLPGDGAVKAGRNGRAPDLCVLAMAAWKAAEGRRKVAPPPILAVEVLSESNTAREMRHKRRDYFGAGVEEAWFADPEGLTVEVWTDEKKPVVYGVDDAVPCDRLFPGLRVPVKDWLEGRLTRRAAGLLDAMEPPPA